MRERFFETLNYASVNEDWRTEAEALRVGPEDRVLCVTGSGARPLDLLAGAAARVVALDANPAQTQLLRLKAAALLGLSFEDYACFLGVRPAPPAWRLERLQGLLADLPLDACRFWRRRRGAVAAGILYQGRWERFYRRASLLARLARPRFVRTLFAFDDLAAQARFVDAAWDTATWRLLFRVTCSRPVSRYLLGDPAYYRSANGSSWAALYARMRASLGRHLARESFMASLVLQGRLPTAALPPHLTAAGAERIRGRIERLEIVTGELPAWLERAPRASFTRFSLSDLPSFLDADGFERLLRGVAHAGAPGARFCIRQFLAHHAWPAAGDERLSREPALEARLALADQAFAYDFIVGECRRGA